MQTNVNEIYLTKSNKVIVDAGKFVVSRNYALSISRNFENLGYILSPELIDRLTTLNLSDLTKFYQETLAVLRKNVGANRKYNPMHPNFPAQVMEASEAELYVNAILHYVGSFLHDLTDVPVRILPEYEKEERLPLFEFPNPKVINLGSREDFKKVFTNLVGSNSSISETDKEIVKWFIGVYRDDIVNLLPEKIPQKEQLALVASELLTKTTKANVILSKAVKTATDVLRIAVALSDGDVSLAAPTKFKKFKRSERKFLLSLLENIKSSTEDMLRWKGYWIKLGEILHPFEFKNRFPKACESFDVLRNNKEFSTFNGKVEGKLKTCDVPEVVKLLKDRPGDFARRLDHIFRIEGGESYRVASNFLSVADKVSTPVLLQVYSHFKNRNRVDGLRAFFPKGNVGKMQVQENKLLPLDEDFRIIFTDEIQNVLVKRFSKLSPLGSVYVDNKLNDYIVPFSQRSASKTLRTISRGSKIDIPDGNTIRFFLWWKDGRDRTDIDLSAVMYDDGWVNQQPISYYNLRNQKRNSAHSGDITSAPNGACEFIDIDIDSFTKDKGRYVVMCLNSFTQQPYCDLPECFAGWMMRSEPKSGEVFEPKTVVDKIDLTANTTISVPVVLDLFERKVIWTDLSLKSRGFLNNVGTNKANIASMAKAISTLDKPNLYDLFYMHATARGILTTKDKATTIFSEHEGLTPYDGDKILAEYLV